MENIKSLLTLVSALSVLCGAALSLVPESKLKKAYSSLTAIVLLFAVISPLTDTAGISETLKEILNSGYEYEEQISEKYNGSVEDAFERGVEKALKEALAEAEIEIQSVSAECKAKQEEVVISSVTVVGDLEAEDIEAAEKIIREYTQAKTKIIFIQG